MFSQKAATEFIAQAWETSIIPTLIDYIRIPNKSPHFDADWEVHGYMEQAMGLIANWCGQHLPDQATMEVVRLPGRTPLLFIDIPGQGEETILLYGHMDKQPEMAGWHDNKGPWQPVLDNGKLYGRGGADDGYAVFASLTAIRALQAQGLPHARCVLIIEACEESGSFDLPFYIDQLKDRIGSPNLVICLDSGCGNYQQLWMTTSLRGNVVGRLEVSTIREGVHSGNASGIVADSFRIARQLISRIEDENTGEILLADCHCPIPQQRINQAGQCAEILGDDVYQCFPWQDNAQPVTEDRQQLVLNRTWRPALTVTGADGLPAIADAGNVLRPYTALKLSMRIPPEADPVQAAKAMQAMLTKEPPYGARVAFHVEDRGQGWHAPLLADWLAKAADQASQNFYGRPAAYMGEGGTIPFMGMLGEKFPQAQFVITGVLGPQSNAHGPNEFLHLDFVKKLNGCIAEMIYAHYCQHA